MTWWDTSYLFRRRIQTTTLDKVPSGHPVTVNISYGLVAMGKINPDFSDVVPVYFDGTISHPLPSRSTHVGSNIQVQFNLFADLPAFQIATGHYYVYYGNQHLIATPVLSSYMSSAWPLTAKYDAADVTYTRPGEDWHAGVTTRPNAKVVFTFSGTQVRLIADKDKTFGILNLQLDNNPPQQISLYSQYALQAEVVFSSINLTPMTHTVRITNLNRRSPASLGTSVNIVQFDYLKYIGAQDVGEDIVDFHWGAAIGGTA